MDHPDRASDRPHNGEQREPGQRSSSLIGPTGRCPPDKTPGVGTSICLIVERLSLMAIESRANGVPTAVDNSASTASGLLARRDLLRRGTKLVFIAPVLMTFSAQQAHAVWTRHSCYKAGRPGAPCTAGAAEPCCSGLCFGMNCA